VRGLRRAGARHEHKLHPHQLDGLAPGAKDARGGPRLRFHLAMSGVLARAQAKIDGDDPKQAAAAPFSLSKGLRNWEAWGASSALPVRLPTIHKTIRVQASV
jgi:hypothetical protein